jgi:hypothetical protein
MGLDMYVYTRREPLPAAVDFRDRRDDTRLHYWRKHPDLHGWMEQLYREKGGTSVNFNCVNVALTADDLNRLNADVLARALPRTAGFFYGKSDGTELDNDLTFIAEAREAIAAGSHLYYTSWW